MTARADTLPHRAGGLFLAYTGMETDLLFTQGVDLPGFASYPLLETEEGRARLEGYYRDMIRLGAKHGTGVILESPTWVASRDRGRAIGYSPARLADLNRRAIAHMCAARRTHGDQPTIVSANIGPRGDAYAPQDQMSAKQAEDYHAEQLAVLAQTNVDLISAYTLAYTDEAVGIVRAARRFGLPAVIAFTLETDGRLPTGACLEDAISEVDAQTDGYTAYFMINCAHPDHFSHVLCASGPTQRVRGIVANASRCSHAELEAATKLDDGSPQELGRQLAQMRRSFGQICVLGGCCGTDMRHMACIAAAAQSL